MLGVNGFRELHALDWGPRNAARVIVCAHGYSGNARDFDFLARSLAAGARVICPDFAGRGDSGWLNPLEYHFATFISDIRVLLAELGVQQVEWVGTSMGGLIGMLLASQPGNLVERLVMNDVGAYLPLDALQHISRNLHSPDGFASLAEVEAHLRQARADWGTLTDAQWREMARHHARPAGDGRLRLHYDPAIARIVRPLPFTPGLYFWDAWYRVRCPVLLLRGERSEVFPDSVASTMLDVKPHTQFEELGGCGHAPSLMTRAQAQLVGNFLRGAGSKSVPSLRQDSDEPRKPAAPPGAA